MHTHTPQQAAAAPGAIEAQSVTGPDVTKQDMGLDAVLPDVTGKVRSMEAGDCKSGPTAPNMGRTTMGANETGTGPKGESEFGGREEVAICRMCGLD